MRTEVEKIVNRLRRGRSLPWLRVIDGAELDRPAEPDATPEQVVAPYLWLLGRVGDAIRLTQAGYLPPAVVKAAMQELGWLDGWYGAGNREADTPVHKLRESARRFVSGTKPDLGPVTATSTATQPTFTDTEHQIREGVFSGQHLTVTETLGAHNTGSYTTTLACDHGVTPDANGSFTLTAAEAEATVTCTFTNARRPTPPTTTPPTTPPPPTTTVPPPPPSSSPFVPGPGVTGGGPRPQGTPLVAILAAVSALLILGVGAAGTRQRRRRRAPNHR